MRKNKIPVYIRLRYQHAESSLQLFEAANSYCPIKSVIFFSRLNITPYPLEIIGSVQETKMCKKINRLNNSNQEFIFMMIPKYINSTGELATLENV